MNVGERVRPVEIAPGQHDAIEFAIEFDSRSEQTPLHLDTLGCRMREMDGARQILRAEHCPHETENRAHCEFHDLRPGMRTRGDERDVQDRGVLDFLYVNRYRIAEQVAVWLDLREHFAQRRLMLEKEAERAEVGEPPCLADARAKRAAFGPFHASGRLRRHLEYAREA